MLLRVRAERNVRHVCYLVVLDECILVASDFGPILKSGVVIDFDNTAVQRIATFFLGARDPVPRSGLFLDAVVFIAGLRFQKAFSGVRAPWDLYPASQRMALPITM